jgi:uncharacterized protein YgiM (DUF1202 family)
MKKIILLAAIALSSCAPMYITTTRTPGPLTPQAASHTLPARSIEQSTKTPSATIEPQCFRVIALEALHIRSEPSEKSKVVGYARFGQRLTMIQAGAWSRIRTTDQLTGYVNSKYIQEGCAP